MESPGLHLKEAARGSQIFVGAAFLDTLSQPLYNETNSTMDTFSFLALRHFCSHKNGIIG